MHGYSTDSNERRIVPLVLALLAIALAWMSSKFLGAVHLAIPWSIDAPSSMAFYGGLYPLFDKYLLRKDLARKLGLVQTPTLTAPCPGSLLPSFYCPAERHDIFIHFSRSYS